jgi:hypothetical protein
MVINIFIITHICKTGLREMAVYILIFYDNKFIVISVLSD